MVTIKDIAKRLGVAPSTVARALADHPHVHEDTKARVRAVAATLGYVAHAPARAMRGGHSGLIGLMVPDIRNEFYASAAQALSEAAASAGFRLLLSISGDEPAREADQVLGLVSARCAGLVIVPSARPVRQTLALLARVPHVQFVRRGRGVAAPWFGVDDAAATALATRHLIRLGHRRIGYVGGDLALSTGAARFAGYRDALAASRIAASPRLAAHGPGDPGFAADAVRAMLRAPSPPTGLVLGGTRLTVGALDAVREARLALPDDLSLVGFNDSTALGWWGGGITSVGLPVRDMALACAAGLFEAIRAGAGDREQASVAASFAPFLVQRGSTATPAGVKATRRASR